VPPLASPFDAIAAALLDRGWGVFTGLLPVPLTDALCQRARALSTYRAAAIGRQTDTQLNPFVRRDRIAWIEPATPEEQGWLEWAESLRTHLNHTLMLGLASFESHFALYGPGDFYRRHLDAFQGGRSRMVSVVLYLNPAWLPSDGGELVLYGPNDNEIGRFPPVLGTLVVYLSERFPHEVLPTRTHRYSIAGWFRQRPEPVLAHALDLSD
jgi:SM-20-related protein